MRHHLFLLSDHACECGCGRLTTVAPFTWARTGWVKGQPIRFVKGHYRRDLMPKRSLADLFWSKVDVRGPKECWLWTGYRDVHGYGYLTYQHKRLKAHRVSLVLHGGVLLPGQGALHKCDNPPCVNPEDLFAGTQLENLADMNRKGRGNQGERNANAKLTREAAREIRRLVAEGVALQELAAAHGVTVSAVYDIRAGRTWKELPC